MLRRLISPQPDESDPLDRTAFLAARDVCARHARSFHFASHFLPVPKRYAAYAVYAFCRMLDDAVDALEAPGETASGGAASPRDVEASLRRFATALDRAYEREPERVPLDAGEQALALRAFALTVRRYAIPKAHFEELALGCRMDLTVTRYDTWADLQTYCYRVAGVVGLVMCSVFGLRDERARANAVRMGDAMQLTNILRDVGEDWGRGRLYLPREDLDRFGYTEADVARGVVDDRFRQLMAFEVDRARRMFRDGADGLCALPDDGSRLTASAMAVIYAGILGAIERRGYDVYTGRAHLTAGEKVRRLPAAWRLSKREAGEPVPDVFT
ncbi:MAG TPA: phytoene/squalene synthase family protein [Humisphaera sp.]